MQLSDEERCLPKRDESYLRGQREAIARAALPVLLEKGYHDTTTRDICKSAGVSNGGFYHHFATREAAIVEACALDQVDRLNDALPSSWAEYVNIAENGNLPADIDRSKRFRMMMQFAAEISQMDKNPDGYTEYRRRHRYLIERALLKLKELGIVTLPLGAEKTAEVHHQLGIGAYHNHYSNHDADLNLIRESYREAIAMTAGLIEESTNSASI